MTFLDYWKVRFIDKDSIFSREAGIELLLRKLWLFFKINLVLEYINFFEGSLLFFAIKKILNGLLTVKEDFPFLALEELP